MYSECRKRNQDLFNAMGSMYSAVLFMGVSYSSSVQPVVAIEKTVFYRERAAGMYSALPYAFGQVNMFHCHIVPTKLQHQSLCIVFRKVYLTHLMATWINKINYVS